jgi:hypothetical protein
MLDYNQDLSFFRSNRYGTTSSVCPRSRTEPSARNLFHCQHHLCPGDSGLPGIHWLSSTWRARVAGRKRRGGVEDASPQAGPTASIMPLLRLRSKGGTASTLACIFVLEAVCKTLICVQSEKGDVALQAKGNFFAHSLLEFSSVPLWQGTLCNHYIKTPKIISGTTVYCLEEGEKDE